MEPAEICERSDGGSIHLNKRARLRETRWRRAIQNLADTGHRVLGNSSLCGVLLDLRDYDV